MLSGEKRSKPERRSCFGSNFVCCPVPPGQEAQPNRPPRDKADAKFLTRRQDAVVFGVSGHDGVFALDGSYRLSTLTAQSSSSPDEPDFIVPARPTVSNPAEFQRPGVLQLEFGDSANFHAPGVRVTLDTPVALRFAVSRRLLLEFDGDDQTSQTVGGAHTTGIGDTQLGMQFVLQHEKER